MATIDLSQFKKVAETTPQAGATAPVVPSATPAPQDASGGAPAPVSNASLMPKQVDLSQFKKPQKLGLVGSIYKGLAEPVLNMIARPAQAFQHITGGIQQDAGKEAPIEGDIPLGFGIKAKITDPYITAQKKGAIRAIAEDVGRGAQTVAIGMGPVSGGAAFSGGASLEESAATGKDLAHTAKDVIIHTALGAATGYVTSKAFEFTGKAIQGGMEKLKRPFASSFDKETAKVFQERGIDAPVSALTNSKFVKAGEAVGEGSMFGNKISKTVESARTQIFDIADSLKKEIDPESLVQGAASPEQVGLQLQGALNKTKNIFQTAKTKIYEDATGRISTNPAILDNTKATLQSIIDSKSASLDPTSKAQVKFYQNLLNSMRTASKRSFETVKQTRTAIGTRMKNRMDPIASGDTANLGRLYGALTDDLDITASQFDPAAGEALKAANEYFKGGMEVINSYAGRMIYRSKSPENIVRNIVKPGDVTNVKMLKGLVGDEAFRGVRTVFADDIIKNATDPLSGRISATKLSSQLSKYGDDVLDEMLTPEGSQMFRELQKSTIINDIVEKGTKEGKVLPGRFEQAFKRYGEDTLKKVLSPEEFKALNDVMTMSKSLEFGRKIAEGSQTYEKVNQGLNLVLAIIKWPVALAKVAGEFGITQATASKIGKKWLTEGFGPGFFETGVKAVGKAIEQAPKAVTPGIISEAEKAIGVGAKSAGKTIFRYSEKAVEEGAKVPGKVIRYNKSIPNKQGGFIKNPLAEEVKKVATKTQEDTLVAIHNLTSANLQKAEKIGGLANPSIAVLDPSKHSFESFGDITLVVPKELLTSKGAKTYAADAYSPRFPSTVTTVDFKKYDKVAKEMGIDLKSVDLEDFFRSAENSEEVMSQFLEKQGIKAKGLGISDLRKKITPLQDEFNNFIDDIAQKVGIEEKIFKGFSYSGKRKYSPLTVENASKEMNTSETRGGESFFYGLGSVRAKITPKFANVAAIKKAQSRLVSTEDFAKIKDVYEKDFGDLIDEMNKYSKNKESNSFIQYDHTGMNLGEYLGGDKKVLNDFFENVPESLVKRIEDFRMKLLEMPTEYFETKFRRPVSLQEFSHAIVPEDISPATLKLLEKKGIPVVTYKKGEGNQSKKLLDYVAENGLMFALTPVIPIKKVSEEKKVERYQ